MKKVLYIAWMVSGLLAGCNDWLDVNPKTESKESELFRKEEGFKDALIGAYIEMKQDVLYGQNLTYTTVEYLAQHWNYSMETKEERLCRFEYTDREIEAVFSEVYGKFYHVIALVNNILAQVDEKKGVFDREGSYQLVKGEALAIRAWMHFDVLRLFGPVPEMAAGSGKILPYVRELSRNPNSLVDYATYTGLLEDDLEAAAGLLEKCEPLIGNHLELFNENDNFILDRSLRINYFALKGLMARYYLWTGKEEAAYECAKELIESENAVDEPRFPLAGRSDFEGTDKTLKKEWLFGISVFDLAEDVDFWFVEARGGAKLTRTKENVLADLYENVSADSRSVYLWEDYTSDVSVFSYRFRKYADEGLQSLPMLRIPELWLIAAETAPTLELCNQYFKTFRESRNLGGISFTSKEQARKEILKEYEKEFFGEGQMFYAYKRINSPAMLWALVPITPSVYKIPLPQDETDYIR